MADRIVYTVQELKALRNSPLAIRPSDLPTPEALGITIRTTPKQSTTRSQPKRRTGSNEEVCQ